MITDEALDLLERGALPSDAPAIRELVAFYRRFAGVRLGDVGKPDPHLSSPKKAPEVAEAIARAHFPAPVGMGPGRPQYRDRRIFGDESGVVTCDPLPPVDLGRTAYNASAAPPGGRPLDSHDICPSPFGPARAGTPAEAASSIIAGALAPRRATPAEEAALEAAHELVTDPGGRRPFDSMPCPHSFIVVDKCRACGAYMGPQP